MSLATYGHKAFIRFLSVSIILIANGCCYKGNCWGKTYTRVLQCGEHQEFEVWVDDRPNVKPSTSIDADASIPIAP